MSVSKSYHDFVMDQLGCLGSVSSRKMFGGVGIYMNSLFFALISDDTLYFKVDDSNREDFESKDMEAFQPFPDKPMIMQYYEVPVEILEDEEELYEWGMKAWEVARSKAKKKR